MIGISTGQCGSYKRSSAHEDLTLTVLIKERAGTRKRMRIHSFNFLLDLFTSVHILFKVASMDVIPNPKAKVERAYIPACGGDPATNLSFSA